MRIILVTVIVAIATLAGPTHARSDGETWLLVDTAKAIAEVRRGEEAIVTIPNLSFGRGGVAPFHMRGDKTTPVGEYRIRRISHESRYHVFLQLNYPTMEHLDAAHRNGSIADETYETLLDYVVRYGYLPQDTPLGGNIGLHGIGTADPSIHGRFHWTQGCVAMTDDQINSLLRFVDVGTRVVIR